MRGALVLSRGIDHLSLFVGRAVAWLALLTLGVAFLVAVLRYLFAWGDVWMQELYVWSHATVFLLGAGYTLLYDGHVRIDVFRAGFPPRVQATIDIAGTLFLGLPLLFFTLVRSWPQVERSWRVLERSGEAGGLPGLFLFKTLIPVFCVLLSLQMLSLLLERLVLLFSPALLEEIPPLTMQAPDGHPGAGTEKA